MTFVRLNQKLNTKTTYSVFLSDSLSGVMVESVFGTGYTKGSIDSRSGPDQKRARNELFFQHLLT